MSEDHLVRWEKQVWMVLQVEMAELEQQDLVVHLVRLAKWDHLDHQVQ